MCGILAWLSNIEHADQVTDILNGIENILNRGYDSIGLVSGPKNLITVKNANNPAYPPFKAQVLQHIDKLNKNSFFLCHTRWSTHGGKTTNNAHPHCDESKRFFLVHNGMINNYQKLVDAKICYKSDTDTEVVVQLIGQTAKLKPKKTTLNVFYDTVRKLEGTWAFVLVDLLDPDSLYISRSGSPLVVGFDAHTVCVSSEQSGLTMTESCVRIPEGVVGKITVSKENGVIFQEAGTKNAYHDLLADYLPHETLLNTKKTALPPQFKHWTAFEITSQPESLFNAMNRGGRISSSVKLGGLENEKKTLESFNHLVFIASGSSYFACHFILNLFYQGTRFDTVQLIEASEFRLNRLPKKKGITGCVFVSQSGETYDVHQVLSSVRDQYHCIGVVNVPGSVIAQETHCGVFLNAGKETGVAATKSFTSQLVVLTLLFLWFHHKQPFCWTYEPLLVKMPTLFRTFNGILKNYAVQLCALPVIANASSIFLLGSGIGHSTSMEGALKIKELAYVHTEAFPLGALKHGPFSLLQKTTPVFVVITKPSQWSVCEQIRSRDAPIIVITNLIDYTEQKCYDHVIPMNVKTHYELGFLTVLFYQWFAYELAVQKKHDPDKPRNLAKTVTVA